MTKLDIIDIQLESILGHSFEWRIQKLVDKELTNGIWIDGYDMAVSNEVIGTGEAKDLLSIILKLHPHLTIDEPSLLETCERFLPQSIFTNVTWIVEDSGSFALSDSLRVARFDMNSLIWCSSRISYDGVEFDSLSDGKLVGRAWLASSSTRPDSEFIFDFDTGELIKGASIEP